MHRPGALGQKMVVWRDDSPLSVDSVVLWRFAVVIVVAAVFAAAAALSTSYRRLVWMMMIMMMMILACLWWKEGISFGKRERRSYPNHSLGVLNFPHT
jgi:hypothetical protein